MRICVSGTQNIGKSTFIKNFLEEFTMYKTPDTSYRDIISKYEINQQATEEVQREVRDFISDQAMNYTSASNIIYDRGILDNAVYSLWKNDKDSDAISDGFIHQSLHMCREVCKFYDIIFYFPITQHHEVEITDETKFRDTDSNYREEIDMLFKAALQTYHKKEDLFFDMRDAPAIIELFGDEEMCMEICKMYLDPATGDVIEPGTTDLLSV